MDYFIDEHEERLYWNENTRGYLLVGNMQIPLSEKGLTTTILED